MGVEVFIEVSDDAKRAFRQQDKFRLKLECDLDGDLVINFYENFHAGWFLTKSTYPPGSDKLDYEE